MGAKSKTSRRTMRHCFLAFYNDEVRPPQASTQLPGGSRQRATKNRQEITPTPLVTLEALT